MCILNWCYKQYRKTPDKICIDNINNFDDSLIICDEKTSSVDKCICKDLSTQKFPLLTNETVNVAYYPCLIDKSQSSVDPRESIECDCSDEESESTDPDYEIQFTGEEDEEDYEEEESSNFDGEYDGNIGEEQSEQSLRNPNVSSESRQNMDGENMNDSRKTSESNNMSKISEISVKSSQ